MRGGGGKGRDGWRRRIRIWHALELSHLKPSVEGQGLEQYCEENGESLRYVYNV
jgi:hypothetical protein